MPRRLLSTGAAAGGTCAVLVDVAVLGARATDPADPALLAALAAAAWSAPLVLASALLLCAWKVGGRAAPAHWGTAAALAGAAGPGVAVVVAAAHPSAAPAAATAAVTAGLVAASLHVRAALRGPQVRTDVRPVVAVVTGTCLVLAVGAGTALLAGGGPPRLPVLPGPEGVWVLGALGAVSGAVLAGALHAFGAALRHQRLRVLAVLSRLQRRTAEVDDDRLRRHDARSALAAVRAASAVLTGDQPAAGSSPSSAERAELAAAVRTELSRVERLLGGTEPRAAAGAAAAGAAGARPGVVDLRGAAAPVVAAWRAQGMDVEGPPAGEPAWGIGDDDAVRRVVANLLDNAARYAPGAPVRLAVGAADDGRVVLVVADGGPGVPAAARDAVFRAGTRLRDDARGEGLGLASARALAEADGGSLRLVDAERGARFELRLPAAQPAAQPVARAADLSTAARASA